MNRAKYIFVTALLTLSFTALTASAGTAPSCDGLTRNLKTGMTGSDVVFLQKILNADSRTSVAASGIGSSGNETDYFGVKTMNAVIRFQELNRADVLTPVGLTRGNGYVGTFTRLYITKQCLLTLVQQYSTPTTSPTLVPAPAPSPTPAVVPLVLPQPVTSITNPSSKGGGTIPLTSLMPPSSFNSSASSSQVKPYIMFSSLNAVKLGEKLTIYGGGWSNVENIVHFGNVQISRLLPTASGNIEFSVPSNVAYGKQLMWVSNERGETYKKLIVVIHDDTVAPVILGMTPSEGLLGTMITITGTGFTSTNNEIRFAGASIIASSADGKTITFEAQSSIPGAVAGADLPMFDATYPAWFYVANDNGFSNDKIFYIKA